MYLKDYYRWWWKIMFILRLTLLVLGSFLLIFLSRIRFLRRVGVEDFTMTLDNWVWRFVSFALLRGRFMVLSWISIWSSVVRVFLIKSKKDRVIEMFFFLVFRWIMKFLYLWFIVCSFCFTFSVFKFVRRRSWFVFRISRRIFFWICCKNMNVIF